MEELEPIRERDLEEYEKYMNQEKELDDSVSNLDFGNIHIFAQKMVIRDNELSKKLLEELKWQVK